MNFYTQLIMKNILGFLCAIAALCNLPNTASAQNTISLWKNGVEIKTYTIEQLDTIMFLPSANVSPGDVTINGHEFVDLGLPSGLLWATCNVGAKKPTESGLTFAWGETETKDNYTGKNYKFYDATNTYSKYNKIDKKTRLEAIDDAAVVNWGNACRMPKETEFNELEDNCTFMWITIDGVSGMLATGKNGKNVFFPATTSLFNEDRDEYWSVDKQPDDEYFHSPTCLKVWGAGFQIITNPRSLPNYVRPVATRQ